MRTDYLAFFFSLFLSRLADQILLFLVPLIVFQTTNSASWAGLAFFVETLPRFLAFPMCGALCDRFSPIRLLHISQVYRAGVCLVAMVLYGVFGGIGWLVALIGSSIAFYHQNPSKTRSGRTTLTLSIAQQEQLSLAVAIAIIQHFQEGKPPLTDEALARNLDSNLVAVEQALEQLQKIGLIRKTGDQPPAYLPSHRIEDCTMVAIWQALRESNTDHISVSDDSAELMLAHQFQQDMESAIESSLGDRKFVDLKKI